MNRTIALVVAAGSGTRAGGHRPKQYVEVAGRPLLCYSLQALLAHPLVDEIRVVIGHGHEELYASATAGLPLPPPITGGATRQESVRRGLEALAAGDEPLPRRVLIHDAARPFLPGRVIVDLLTALRNVDGALPGLAVVDTIKRVDENDMIIDTPPRHLLRAAQTPQAFHFDTILAAHRQVADMAVEFSDDAAIAEHAGLRVKVIDGAPELRKVTYEEDFRWAAETARKLGLA